MHNEWLLATMIAFIVAAPTFAQTGPEYGGKYTRQRIANLRANVEKYPWAKRERDSAVSAAKWWVEQPDEVLWDLIPSQDVPRNIDPQMDHGVRTGGCPVCGKDVYERGKYPWKVDWRSHPWKVICPECGTQLPKNDFGKFYQSGIDETGCFNPEKADRSLLFNEEHPDPNDPLDKWMVDDGWGFEDKDGSVNRFVGYYTFMLWYRLKGGIAVLANAYLYTGDPLYARKCAIMLDRIADVYPDMDWSVYGKQGWFHSGSTDGGKIEGSIWETGTVTTVATAYDKIKSGLYDQPDLYAVLADKGGQYKLPTPKGTYEQLVGNIETNLLGEFVKAVKSGRAIYGNEGGPQHCVIMCAVALNREPLTSEWIEWTFKEGSVGQGALKPGEGDHIPALIVGTIDRDGAGAEGAPGYSLSWGVALGAAADLLADYEGYTKRDIYRDYPMFNKTITAGWRLGVLAAFTPNIGDAGSCGSRGLIAADPQFIVRGYKYLKDPGIGLMAVWANHGKTETLGRDILAADPLWVEKDLAALAEKHGAEPSIAGDNNTGYGLVSIEFSPRDTGQAIWMFYGLNGVAGHKSELMFGYDAYGVGVSAPLGYRELWGGWPKSLEWEDNTISHNTAVVNELPQSTVRVGHPEFFVQFPDFGGFSVDSHEVYRGITDVFSRTMALMKVGENASYALDVFRIRGGKDHLLSFHALPGPVDVHGLNLVKQEGGSYAGLDVPYGTSMKGPRMGYSWLKDVERDTAPPASFVLDFHGTLAYPNLKDDDNLHLRYHNLTEYSDVALADGIPPGAKPEKLRFLLAHNAGADGLASTCVAVIEPYKNQPHIKQVTRLEVTGGDGATEAVAIKVELADGGVDYLLNAPDEETVYQVEGGLTFSGRLAALRTRDGLAQKAWLIRASRLTMGAFSAELPTASYKGTVVKMDKDMEGNGCLWVDTELPTDGSLAGSEIIIANDRVRNACYTIHAVEQDGELWRVDCGDVCFIRQFVDNYDYSKGYIYDFAEGANWCIPTRLYVGNLAH